MKDRIETQRPRMTEGERQRVWGRIREKTTSAGRAPRGSEFSLSRWFKGRRLLTPMAVGAMATVVLAVVLWDRAPQHDAELDRIRDQAIGRAPSETAVPPTPEKDDVVNFGLSKEKSEVDEPTLSMEKRVAEKKTGSGESEVMAQQPGRLSDKDESFADELPVRTEAKPEPAPQSVLQSDMRSDFSPEQQIGQQADPAPEAKSDLQPAPPAALPADLEMADVFAADAKLDAELEVEPDAGADADAKIGSGGATDASDATQQDAPEATRDGGALAARQAAPDGPADEVSEETVEAVEAKGRRRGAPLEAPRGVSSAEATDAERAEDRDNAPVTVGTVEGIVRDLEGNPVPYANVMLLGTQLGAAALEDGRFVIRNVPPGVYSARASSMGFVAGNLDTVVVATDENPFLSFAIVPAPIGTLSEVAVTAEKERFQTKRTQTSHDISSKDVESLPVNEIAEAVGLKPGVIAEGESLHYRGGRAGETNVIVSDDSAPAGSASNSRQGRARAESELQAAPPVVAGQVASDEPYDAVFYQDYGSNPLTFADTDPLSTFAVDVDKGSYTIARRYVTDDYLPEPAAVRVEEFVNFFDPGYPEFEGPDFRIFVDGAESPYGDGFRLLRVGLKARSVPEDLRKPANLTFVVDVSGSMSREDRLGLVRSSLTQLVEELRPSDRVGLVVYGSRAEVLLPGTQVAKKERILESIDRLRSAGSTNAEDGLRLGYETARNMYDPEANNRIILCSDGVANVGRTGPEAILEVVRGEADQGIYLTTVGFGMGNYNDVLMEQLANQGDGGYYYIDRLDEADRIFRRELTGTLETIGRDAKIQVEFDPRHVDGYRLIGFENRDVADEDFRNDSIDAGEIGSGHTVVALYEVRLQSDVRNDDVLATVRFRYAQPMTRPGDEPDVTELAKDVRGEALSGRIEDGAPRLQLAAVVAEYAEVLRHSFWAQDRNLRDLVPLATDLAGRLNEDPDVAEFSRLVWKAAEIQDRMTEEEKARRWPHLIADLPGYPDRW